MEDEYKNEYCCENFKKMVERGGAFWKIRYWKHYAGVVNPTGDILHECPYCKTSLNTSKEQCVLKSKFMEEWGKLHTIFLKKNWSISIFLAEIIILIDKYKMDK